MMFGFMGKFQKVFENSLWHRKQGQIIKLLILTLPLFNDSNNVKYKG
jgi:hypothetical protein